MMASLVADYDSSDADESADSEKQTMTKNEHKEAKKTPTSQNFFNSSLSDESDEEAEELEEGNDNLSENAKKDLPNPLSDKSSNILEDSTESETVTSVFANPYALAEQARHSVLEKHVKMVEKKVPRGKEGQICWKFKRGKCRFGRNCKYSHDLSSDIGTLGNTATEESEGDRNCSKNAAQRIFTTDLSSAGQPLTRDVEDEDSYLAQAKRKKRAGVSDRLVPPKKALVSLEKQRQTERPWTVHKQQSYK